MPKFSDAKHQPDLDTLQAIITHRYDVMTRYMQSLKHTCSEEIERLKKSHAGKFDARAMRRWVLSGEERHLCEVQKAQLAEVIGDSKALATVVSMREELAAIWARSTATHEQLLKQLHDWIERAEQSGIQQLQDFSMRLRRYAI